MFLKPIWFYSWFICMQLTMGLYPMFSLAAAPEEMVGKRNQSIEIRVDVLEKDITNRLENNEKLIQAKVDQVTTIAEILENGRKDIDWWLSATAIFLGMAGVLAIVIPVMLQRRQKAAFDAEVRSIRETFNSLEIFERETKAEMRAFLADLREAKREVREHLRDTEDAAKKAKSARLEAEAIARTVQKGKSPEELRSTAKKLQKAKDSPIAKLAGKALEYMEARQWEAAALRWRSLTDIDPESESHWFNLGYVLQQRVADEKDPRVIQANMQEANLAYAEAIRIKPDMRAAYNNWGNVLSEWAKALPAAEQNAKYVEAIEKYAEALRIKSDDHETLSNWATTLFEWGRTLPLEQKLAKYAEANEKFSKAVSIKPDHINIYNNWGATLADWANNLPPDERASKFSEATVKYAEGARLNSKPDNFQIYNNWGAALLNWAKTLPPKEKITMLSDAKSKLLTGEKVRPGSSSYNLACISALLGDSEEAKRWLNNCVSYNTLPKCDHIRNDEDLEKIRKLEWFIEFMKKHCEQL